MPKNSAADDVIENTLSNLVRINFETALMSCMKRCSEIKHTHRSSGAWVRLTKGMVSDEIKAAVQRCADEAERDVPLELRDPPQDFWDRLKLKVRETLFRSLNSIQTSIVSGSKGMVAAEQLPRQFQDLDHPLQIFIENLFGQRSHRDQLLVLSSAIKTVDQIKKVPENKSSPAFEYVHATRIEALRKMKDFDPARLLQLCEELNSCWKVDALLAPAMLVRAVLDHIPPIFGMKSFSEVANNYAYGGRSFKEAMQHLENSSRKIADGFLHTQIRAKEALPTSTQINFSQDLDVLLNEIVRIACD